MKYLLLIALILACGEKKDEKETQPAPHGIDQLKLGFYADRNRALSIRDTINGWLEKGCDGFLWTAKYASVICDSDVDMRASEYEDTGRFGRTPEKRCWTSATGDNGAKNTWSRDHGVGLSEFTWTCKNRQMLQDHIDYGWSTTPDWIMGEPIGDGRVIYTPNMVGLLHQIRFALGGADSVHRHWPTTYPGGLDDYEAHIQTWTIKIRHEVDEKLGAVSLLDVTGQMHDRVLEHYNREPNCPFYSYMYHLFETGDMTEPVELVNSNTFECEYLRGEMTKFIEKIWVSDLILKRYPNA